MRIRLARTPALSRFAGLVLMLCAVAFGQPAANDDPVEVLMRLRDQVLEHGRRIPRHTCVETIQRDRYEPVRGHASKSCDAILAKRQQADLHMLLRLDTRTGCGWT